VHSIAKNFGRICQVKEVGMAIRNSNYIHDEIESTLTLRSAFYSV
jgi:hypothetical protein